ncbi:sm-like protein LSM1B isoform X1 [Cannabis sativa]|uniref:sm-like protein LSM1B isoform X1 n=1 Tax=Cannabis sativa TaxID=3483 RepID=UPI0029C9D2BF|nr:sm-like protein LSM1B isoform X1 [Cannabis sativa]
MGMELVAGLFWCLHFVFGASNTNTKTIKMTTLEEYLELYVNSELVDLSVLVLLYDNTVLLLAEKLLVLLRDGRKLLGLLRSFDQFANVILEGACERAIVGDIYCDIPLGLYVIRGENVVLIGELDLDREELPPHMTQVSEEEIKRAQKVEKDASDLKGTMRKRMEFLDFD